MDRYGKHTKGTAAESSTNVYQLGLAVQGRCGFQQVIKPAGFQLQPKSVVQARDSSCEIRQKEHTSGQDEQASVATASVVHSLIRLTHIKHIGGVMWQLYSSLSR